MVELCHVFNSLFKVLTRDPEVCVAEDRPEVVLKLVQLGEDLLAKFHTGRSDVQVAVELIWLVSMLREAVRPCLECQIALVELVAVKQEEASLFNRVFTTFLHGLLRSPLDAEDGVHTHASTAH